MSRDYSKIQLPYTIRNWQVSFVLRKVVEDDIWYDLPAPLAARLRLAYEQNQDIIVTKADLDSISDKGWAKISALF